MKKGSKTKPPNLDKETEIINISKEFSIPNKLEAVQTAMQHFEAFVKTHEVSPLIIMKINIVFDEIVSNIVNYSFSEKGSHYIDIKMNLLGRTLSIRISDEGQPFNPFQTTPPDFRIPLEEREVGGMGIHLVRKLMDDYNYERTDNKNVVTLVKHAV